MICNCGKEIGIVEIDVKFFSLGIDFVGLCSGCVDNAVKTKILSEKPSKPPKDIVEPYKPALGHCYTCKTLKPKIYLKHGSHDTSIYVDDTDRQWHGRSCPDCHLNRKKKEYKKAIEHVITCLECNTKFKAKRATAMFCSPACGKKFYYTPKPKRLPKVKAKFTKI